MVLIRTMIKHSKSLSERRLIFAVAGGRRVLGDVRNDEEGSGNAGGCSGAPLIAYRGVGCAYRIHFFRFGAATAELVESRHRAA